MSDHGTYSRYVKDRCRCAACTAANTEYSKGRRTGTRAAISEVKEFARSLGFELTGHARKPLIDRYNREHPDRPYLTNATGKDGHGGWDV